MLADSVSCSGASANRSVAGLVLGAAARSQPFEDVTSSTKMLALMLEGADAAFVILPPGMLWPCKRTDHQSSYYKGGNPEPTRIVCPSGRHVGVWQPRASTAAAVRHHADRCNAEA